MSYATRTLRHLLCRPGKRALLVQILGRLDTLEIRMSNLDDATADLTAAVTEVVDLITGPVAVLQAKLDDALARLAEAQSDDVTDAAEIARLTGEAADLVTDAAENATLIGEQAAKLRSFSAPVEPVEPPVEPTEG